jgi:hypothetical protein
VKIKVILHVLSLIMLIISLFIILSALVALYTGIVYFVRFFKVLGDGNG